MSAAGTGAALSQTPRPRRTSRPNILLLMADQHRGDCLGADGNRVVHTPNLDRLAAEGVRFSRAYSSTPTCTPARTALLTGLSPWHHGMLGMTRMADRYPVELPRALRDSGYYTATIGKNHFSPMRNGHGFQTMIVDEHCPCGNFLDVPDTEPRSDYEAWFYSQAPNLNPHATGLGWNDYEGRPFALPERLHATTWTGDTAVNFLSTYERESPFFLKVSFIRPHSPYDPPQRFMERYAEADLPRAQSGKWADKYRPRNSDKRDIWHGELSEGEIRKSRQAYYGCVTQVDEQIGRILEILHQRGMLEDTLILFTSDHGDMSADQHLWRKSYPYEPSARIPMLLRWPQGLLSSKRGTVMDQVVEIRDILPTFLEAAGVESSRQLDGQSLLALIRNNGKGWREYIDLEHNICYSPDNHWNALTDGRQKYIFHARDGAEQLFDLRTDPHELEDHSADATHAADLSRWRQRLIDHLSERGAPFVRNGRLGLRPEGMMTSPLFPKNRQA